MSIAALHDAIRTRFKEKVEAEMSIPVQYDNAPFSKPEGETWCRFEIVTGDSEQKEFGADEVKERVTGAAYAKLYCPVGIGDGALLELGDLIAAQFRRLTVNGVRYLTPSTPKNKGREGAEWRVDVKIRFKYSVNTQKGSV